MAVLGFVFIYAPEALDAWTNLAQKANVGVPEVSNLDGGRIAGFVIFALIVLRETHQFPTLASMLSRLIGLVKPSGVVRIRPEVVAVLDALHMQGVAMSGDASLEPPALSTWVEAVRIVLDASGLGQEAIGFASSNRPMMARFYLSKGPDDTISWHLQALERIVTNHR